MYLSSLLLLSENTWLKVIWMGYSLRLELKCVWIVFSFVWIYIKVTPPFLPSVSILFCFTPSWSLIFDVLVFVVLPWVVVCVCVLKWFWIPLTVTFLYIYIYMCVCVCVCIYIYIYIYIYCLGFFFCGSVYEIYWYWNTYTNVVKVNFKLCSYIKLKITHYFK